MNPKRSGRNGVLAGGNWLIDHVKVLDCWPQQDALANIVSESWGNGGSPYNVLKDLARLGARFPLCGIGLVGDDTDGKRILADCHQLGIDSTLLRSTSSAPTSYSDVMTERATGRRTFFHQRGANAHLAPEHFDFSSTSAKWFHLGYLLLLDGIDHIENGLPRAHGVLARAQSTGLITSLDCVSEKSDRFQTVVKPVLPVVDVLFVNDFEAEQLTGLELGRGRLLDRMMIKRAAKMLLALGVRHHVIIHFPEGACAASVEGRIVWQPAVQVPSELIAGAAGAGDAFAAGCLLAMHDELPLSDALEFGVCAAATSLLHPTCSQCVPALEEALRFGRTHGFTKWL